MRRAEVNNLATKPPQISDDSKNVCTISTPSERISFARRMAILKAFQSMSVAGTGGFKVVSQGIAAALVATAAGLLVAIYAVIAYNYFVARIGVIAMHYRLFAEEFLTALGQGVKRPKPAVVAVGGGEPAVVPEA